jgi:hypothetical protein
MIYRPPGPAAARPPTGADADTLARALDSLCAAPSATAAGETAAAATAAAPTTTTTTARAHISFLKQVPARAPDLQVIARPVFMADLWAVTLAEAPGRTFLLQRGIGGGGRGGGGAGAGAGGGGSTGRSRSWGPRLAEVDNTARSLLERRCEYRARGGVTVKAQAWRTGGGRNGSGGDLRLRLLEAVSPGLPALALAVEAEYAPASSLEQAAPLLDELAAVLQKAVHEAAAAGGMGAAAAGGGAAAAAGAARGAAAGGRLELLRPPYREYSAAGQLTPGAYGPAHAALAYAELVAQAQQQQMQQQQMQQQQMQQQQAAMVVAGS